MKTDRKHVSGANGEIPSIISAGVRIVGDLTSDGEVHIDGVIEGDVRAHSVMVSKSGSVSGAISGDAVRVEGQVKGQISGQSVSLAASARVQGDIAHDTLAVEQGAHFQGHCQPVAEAKVKVKPEPTIKTVNSEGERSSLLSPTPEDTKSERSSPLNPTPEDAKSDAKPGSADRAA